MSNIIYQISEQRVLKPIIGVRDEEVFVGCPKILNNIYLNKDEVLLALEKLNISSLVNKTTVIKDSYNIYNIIEKNMSEIIIEGELWIAIENENEIMIGDKSFISIVEFLKNHKVKVTFEIIE